MNQHWNERLSLKERFAIHSAKGAHEAASGPAVEKETDQISPQLAVDRALQHFMERKSAVTEKQVLGYALKLGITEFQPKQIQEELDRRKGKEVFTGKKNSDTYLTTKEALIAEDRMKEFAASSRAKFCGINPEYSPQKDFLNEGQKKAIHHALNSQDQVIMISGGAGTGKTTLMQEVKAGVEGSQKKLFAFAPSADASRGVLRSKGFEEADTIKRLLDDQDLQAQLKDQVILVDEAGMVGNQTMNGIFEVAKKQNARVILSGDWKQHNSVTAGDAFRLLEQQTKMPVVRVNEIVRQKDKSVYKEAVKSLSEGNLEQGFAKLEKMDSLREIEDLDKRHQQIASDYLKSIKAPPVRERKGTYTPRTAIVVSPTHAEGKAITDEIRNKLKEEGLVGTKEQKFEVLRNLSFTEAEKQDALNYQPGMHIQFYKSHDQFKAGTSYKVQEVSKEGKVLLAGADREKPTPLPFDQGKKFQVFQKEQIHLAEGDIIRITGNGKSTNDKNLNNGENYTVKGFTEEGNLRLSDGKILGKNYQHFSLGYYRTSYASQGKDAHDVLIAQSSASFAASNEKQFYVSVSRGVERCIIYTDDKEALKWAASKQADRMSATEVAEASKDKSLWLSARNAIQRQQIEQYQQDMSKYQPHLTQTEKTHEPDLAFVPPRSGKEIHIEH